MRLPVARAKEDTDSFGAKFLQSPTERPTGGESRIYEREYDN